MARRADVAAVAEPQPQRTPNAEVDEAVRVNLEAELAEHPVAGSWLGAHAGDALVDDVRPEAQAAEMRRLSHLIDRLNAIDFAKLDFGHAFDRALLLNRAELLRYTLVELRPLEKNPMVYVDLAQSSILELMREAGLSPADRARMVTARLWKLGRLFDDARRNLRPSATDLAIRRAIDEAQATESFIRETLPRALQNVADPKLLDQLRAASGDAARALEDFSSWLGRDLGPRARGELPIGRERLMTVLRLGEGVDVTPELLVSLGEREIKDARRRLDQAAAALAGRGPGADVNKLLEEDHGKPEDLLTSAQDTLQSAVSFARAQKLVTLPEPERPKVVEMPPALWGYAQLYASGPLEPHPKESYLWIDPVDKTWSEKRKLEHLRTFNRPVMVRSVLHEALGHYLLAELDRRAPTTMQKIALSPMLVEGWAGYVEEMMLAEGFLPGDARARVAVTKSTLLRAARLVASVRLHALGARLDDAAKVFTDEAGLDDYTARREAERVAVDPLVLTDALGRVAIVRLRDDWRAAHPNATLGAFHDALLAHGTPSPIALRRILLPGDTKSPL